jgi:signal transduction histidine kinase
MMSLAAPSVRGRILIWYLVLIALALAVSAVLTRQLLLGYLDQRADNELANEVSELPVLVHHGIDPTTGQRLASVDAVLRAALARGLPEPDDGAITLLDGRVVGTPRGPQWVTDLARSAAPVQWADVGTSTYGNVQTVKGPARYLAVPVALSGSPHRGVFVALVSQAHEAALVAEVTRLGAETGAAALLVASLIAWLVAGRLLRPVRHVTELARSISETDLSRRIPVHGSDEISVLAQTFNAMLDRLNEAFGAQRAFVQDASHELRTPITIVRGQLDVMGDDPNERRETLALVFDELDRMDRMVRDLLTLASLARPHPLRLSYEPLTPMVEEIFTKAESLGPRHWELAARVGDASALVDRQRITQAMLQLATNAVQHTGADDTIVIGATVADHAVRLSVADTGPGLAPDQHQRIFERFARAGEAQPRSDGAGLGLAIVRAIADAHRGSVEIDSAPGHGATFTMVVPHVAEPDLVAHHPEPLEIGSR